MTDFLTIALAQKNPIVGDVKSVLEDMYLIYNELNGKQDKNKITSWMKQIKEWSKKDCMAYKDDEVVGRATGGNYGFRVQKSLALGMVKPEFSKVGTQLIMDILGKLHKVEVINDSPYDPENKIIRA